MTRLHLVYFGVLLLIPVVDTVLIMWQRRSRGPRHVVERRSLFLIWLGGAAGMATAVVLKGVVAASIVLTRPLIAVIAITLMFLGMVLRWAAVTKLGSSFSPHVEIGAGQELITDGVFRYVRHPAYAGILIIFAGIGFTFENWLSLLAVVAMGAPGVMHRVRIEEKALRQNFGAAYEEYSRRTKRFLPLLF